MGRFYYQIAVGTFGPKVRMGGGECTKVRMGGGECTKVRMGGGNAQRSGWVGGGMHKGQDIVNKFGSKNKYFSTECEILKTLLSLSMIHKPNTVCYMNSMMC